jgi:hypothetical protein
MLSRYIVRPRSYLGDSVVRLILLLAGNEVAMLSQLFFPDFIKSLTVDALVGRRACF